MSGSPFAIRRMRPEDKPAILEIASLIWDGTDYLPVVFDEWVADSTGEFVAVLLEGRVAGCAKLTFLTPTDAWLEGLRKDPRVLEHGLARAAAGHLLGLLSRRSDLTSVRFSTHVKNRASVISNERLGFRVRTRLSVKMWEGSRAELDRRVPDLGSALSSPVSPIRDEGAIREFLRRGSYFEATEGLVAEGWRIFPFSEERFIERYASAGACRGDLGRDGLAGLSVGRIGRRPGRITMDIVYLDADNERTAARLIDNAFQELALFAERNRVEREILRVQWMVPPGERFRHWCSAAGLASREQMNDLLVFEYPLEKLRELRGSGGTS